MQDKTTDWKKSTQKQRGKKFLKRIVISSKEAEPKRKLSMGELILWGWTLINLTLSFCLSVFSIAAKWGNGTVAIVWLILLAVYIVIFACYAAISRKNSRRLRSRLSVSIVGLKLLTGISNLASLVVSLILLIAAGANGDISTLTAVAAVTIFLLFTLLGIILNIRTLIKKHR